MPCLKTTFQCQSNIFYWKLYKEPLYKTCNLSFVYLPSYTVHVLLEPSKNISNIISYKLIVTSKCKQAHVCSADQYLLQERHAQTVTKLKFVTLKWNQVALSLKLQCCFCQFCLSRLNTPYSIAQVA